jgi:hypothetical protein
MWTRSMNRGCFCVVFFDVLIFFPFVPNTVAQGFCCLACCKGCLSPNAKPMPWPIFTFHEARNGSKAPASGASARGCPGCARSWWRIPEGVIDA